MEIPKELRQRMEQLVRKTVKEFKLDNISTPEEVAEKLGLTIQNGPLSNIDGFFHDDTRVIVINERVQLAQRKRFTSFHEICHYLLRNDDEFFSELNDLYDDDDEFRQVEEKLCNIGATEFLMPRTIVSSIIDEQGFSINLLHELEVRFNVSKQSAMWRLAECATNPCILAICLAKFDGFPTNFEAKDIVVENTWNSDWTAYKLRKNTSIPVNHPIWKSLYSADDTFSFENSFIQFYTGNQMNAHVEGIWINGRAYVIFTLC
jgi:Zn-dependent peptidase ImmA (M78 family)